MRHGWLVSVLCCWIVAGIPVAWADSAEQLFARYEPALLQIQVLEQASGAKASIGSGFVIDQPNVLVTNYHVVSDAVLFPTKYRLEYIDNLQRKGTLTVLAVDVINDLALLATDYQPEQRFHLEMKAPSQGATIYSLGNPHDLGMIVVPGTYNGLQKFSYYPRIHFTGAVNAGMSGGPVVDSAGNVIGVNVASAGNQLGFLVPVKAVSALLARHAQQGDAQNNQQFIAKQLQQSQAEMFQPILAATWQLKDFGQGKVPDEVVPFVRCWGESNVEKEQDALQQVRAFCSQSDEIFLSNRFTTGRLEMQFEWLEGKNLHPLQFYNLYQQNIRSINADNQAEKDDVTAFECKHQVVQQANRQHAKTIFCVRAYRQYEGLYDVIYLAAALDQQQAGMISHYTLSGVSQDIAQQFNRKFTEAVLWQ